MLRGEELRQGECDEASVEAEGEIGHAHQPDGGGEAAKVQTNLLGDEYLGWRADVAWRLDKPSRWRVHGRGEVG
jgi:hypothetical protein